MTVRSDELRPGAYLADPKTTRLYEVQHATKRQVQLIDVRSPIDDPTTIGMLTANAIRMLELVRPAPSVENIASVEEWGPLG